MRTTPPAAGPSVGTAPPSRSSLIIYRVFIIALAIWTGGGVFQTISEHQAWNGDPVGWVRHHTVPAGTMNPWPLTTALLALATLIAFVAFARYRGAGRRDALITIGGTFVTLLATGFYFVPRFVTIFGRTDSLTNEQIVTYSNQWILLNAIRLVFLLVLLYFGLGALGRMSRRA